MANPWVPPTGGSWDNLDLYLRQEQSVALSVEQGDTNKTNAETALNWLGDRVMSYSYIAGLSIAGRATDSAGNVSVITAGSDHQILRRNGTSLGFGSIDLSQSGAVGSSILGTGNGGTGLSAIGTALQYIRVNAGGTALEYATLSVTGFVPYTGATQDLSMGIYSIAATGLNLSGLTASRLVATNGSKKLESLSGTGLVRLTSGAITYDSSAYITLTSLSSTATGLSYSNTTGVFSLTAGYVIPTTNDVSFWNSAYNNRITSLSVTGSSGSATLLSNVLNIPTYTLTGLGATASTLAATQTFTLAPIFSAMTSGSVLFAGTSGLLSQDNGKFTYSPTGYNSNAFLLINGTAGSPTASATFHVRGSGATSATNAMYVENSSGTQLLRVRDIPTGTTSFEIGDGTFVNTTYIDTNQGVATVRTRAITVRTSADTLEITGGLGAAGGNLWSPTQSLMVRGTYALIGTNKQGAFSIIPTFSPASGSVDFAGLVVAPTINQNPSATGITYGIFNYALTSLAYNFKGLSVGLQSAYSPNAAITTYNFSEIIPIINASVNSQVINGLTIGLTGSNGAFTGVIRNALTLSGGSLALAAGTTLIAPLMFTSGTNLTTPVNGAIEYNGTNFFATRTGAVREGILTQSAVTTEVVVSDTTVTVNIGGVSYKLLARA